MRYLDDRIDAVLLDPGAVHPRVHVYEQSDFASAPGGDLRGALGERGYAHAVEPLGELADAARGGSDGRVGDEHVRGPGLADGGELKRSRALEGLEAVPDEPPHDEGELRRLYVRSPTVRVAEQPDGYVDVGIDDLGIDCQSGRQDRLDV